MRLTHFDSFRDYLRFSGAREFWHPDATEGRFEYGKNLLERIGDRMVRPFVIPTDGVLRRLREPAMWTILTTVAIGLVTLFYYPEEVIRTAIWIMPPVALLRPWMGKFAVYAASQTGIAGLGIRTLGRLSNRQLMAAWTGREVVPISIGTNIQAAAGAHD